MENAKSVRAQVLAMEPGQTLVFAQDVCRYATLKSYASDFSYELLRKYSTHRNKATRMVEITRDL